MAHAIFSAGSLLLCCAYAVWRGGAPERQVAGIHVGAVLMSLLLSGPLHFRFRTFETGVFAVDVGVLLSFLLIAVRANRYWTLWLTALQCCEVSGHLLALIGWRQLNLTTAILAQVWIYPELIVMVIGTFRHRLRMETYGVDRPWSHSWLSLRREMLASLRHA